MSEVATTLPSVDVIMGEILDLQSAWTAENTSEMAHRGMLVRTALPVLLRLEATVVAETMGVPQADLGIEGSDGKGNKTVVPWVRVYSVSRSPSATQGWYLVYLFSATGDRIYLSLNQGTSTYNGVGFVPRDSAVLKARVAWARPLLAARLAERADLVADIALEAAQSRLGGHYEDGNVVAIEYRRDAIPGPEVLISDLLYMASLLRIVYQADEEATYVPGEAAPEVVEAEVAAAKTAGRRSAAKTGQGFRLTAEERRAVELHSVDMATAYFQAQGWQVRDVGAKESYDLRLTKAGQKLHVEVKGTTSEGAQVVLTRAEVETQRKLAPHNALVVVHSISLDRTTNPVTASGGILVCVSPWTVHEDQLTVVSYLYRTGL